MTHVQRCTGVLNHDEKCKALVGNILQQIDNSEIVPNVKVLTKIHISTKPDWIGALEINL